jgi:hypothetical protein
MLDLILCGVIYVILVYFMFEMMRKRYNPLKKDDDDDGGVLNISKPPFIDLPPGVSLPDGRPGRRIIIDATEKELIKR